MIDKARMLSTQAHDPAPHYQHTTYGYNYRMSNICAAVGVGQLTVLDDRVARRRAIFDRYAAALARCPGVRCCPSPLMASPIAGSAYPPRPDGARDAVSGHGRPEQA